MSHVCATLRLFKAPAVAMLLLMSMFLAVSTTPAGAQSSGDFVINSVNLTNFRIVENVLRADGTVTGTLAGLPFTTTITNFALQPGDNPTTQQVECSVLDLELAPIHLALLGLHVDTGAICLAITATPGGGLLGDLLCGLAGGVSGIPILPTSNQVNALQSGLVAVLNEALGGDLAPAQADGDSVCTGACEILSLSLGPLNVSLLGVNVSLDDCEGGPVQVCISASRGEGILGDLLCGLSGPLVSRLTLADIVQLINRAVALAPGGFTNQEENELRQLLHELAR
jgi:hypothetical protein